MSECNKAPHAALLLKLEREKLEEEIALLREQRAVVLWQLPVLSNEQVPIALGISQNTWQVWKSKGKTPQPLTVDSTRVLYLTSAIRAWAVSLQPEENDGATDDKTTPTSSEILSTFRSRPLHKAARAAAARLHSKI
jgi:predicted DNA-binding transcriptional regulator AlpA